MTHTIFPNDMYYKVPFTSATLAFNSLSIIPEAINVSNYSR